MKALIVVVLLVGLACNASAQFGYGVYDPPAMPGMSGTLRNPDGSFGGYYSPPLYPGIDSGSFRTPSGDRYIVDEPLEPGGSYTIRRGF